MTYQLQNNILSAEWSDLKFKKNANGVKEPNVTCAIKSKKVPASISNTELDLLISNYVYQYIESSSLSINQVSLLSALLELKQYRVSLNTLLDVPADGR
jgi:hypothetical protein